MEPDRIAFWIVIASCVVPLARIGVGGLSGARGWAAKSVAVLVLAVVSWLLWPAWAGWIALAAWTLLLLLPTLSIRLVMHRTLQQRFANAARYGRIAAWLHPFDGWRHQWRILAAFELAQRGDTDGALAALSALQRDPALPPESRAGIEAHLHRLRGDWDALATPSGTVADSSALRQMRLRALGETGRLHDMIALFRAMKREGGTTLQLCRLYLLAFCGRPEGVALLLDGPLAALDAEMKVLWRATAELAAGERAAAREHLEALAQTSGPVAAIAGERLESDLAAAARDLTPEDCRVLAAVEEELRGEAAFAGRRTGDWRHAPVIAMLILTNLAAFAVELRLGALDRLDELLRLGAMWPEGIIRGGEWWRPLTAIFLHLGLAHVALNMLALAVLGPWVERMLGHGRTLLVYLGAGVGSMLGVLTLISAGLLGEEILAGASGAIFGLIGAEIVLLIRGWRHRPSRVRLSALVVIIGLQVAFDLSTPEVSFSGHAFGLGIGIALTALLGRLRAVAVAAEEP